MVVTISDRRRSCFVYRGKGPSDLLQGVRVSSTDQVSLSSLSEREGPDQPISSMSYVTAPVHSHHAGNNGIWSPGS